MNLIENKEVQRNFIVIWKDIANTVIFKTEWKGVSKKFIELTYNNNFRTIFYLFSIKIK